MLKNILPVCRSAYQIRINYSPISPNLHQQRNYTPIKHFHSTISFMGRVKMIVANWKANLLNENAKQLTQGISDNVSKLSDNNVPEIVICPTYTSLSTVSNVIENNNEIQLGVQNFLHKDSGAYTGEVSIPMLKDYLKQKNNINYSLVGHSERRKYFGENDNTVNLKVKKSFQHNIKPIICVGESLDQRESGITDQHITKQVKAALDGLNAEQISKVVFAYEPIWAIGTGKTCDSQEANRVIKLIRSVISEVSSQDAANKVRILYGGSVKPSTIEEQMSMSDIDGALVGGASLEIKSFTDIIKGAISAKTG